MPTYRPTAPNRSVPPSASGTSQPCDRPARNSGSDGRYNHQDSRASRTEAIGTPSTTGSIW